MKVAILSTGGTILGIGNGRLDFTDYKAGMHKVDDIIEAIPEISELADITIEHIENASSCEITSVHWLMLRQKIEYYLTDQDYDGIVIPHGTNTIEETAYFLNLTVNSHKPVVIVGSQRPFSSIGNDAGINLYNAIRVAISKEAQNKGVLVVLNDEINAAREVTKTNTYRLETFQSGDFGFLGYVDADNTVQFYRTPTRKHTTNSPFSRLKLDNLADIAVVYSHAGATGHIIRMINESNKYKGIVMAGTGAGKFSKSEYEALNESVAKGMYVVRSSRVGNGRVVELKEYQKSSFIAADNLLPQKARILLMLALQIESDPSNIQKFFYEL